MENELTKSEWEAIKVAVSADRPSCDPLVAKIEEFIWSTEQLIVESGEAAHPSPMFSYTGDGLRRDGEELSFSTGGAEAVRWDQTKTPTPTPTQEGIESSPGRVSRLVNLLREGLKPLVRDGLITEERAIERSNNMAMILIGQFGGDLG